MRIKILMKFYVSLGIGTLMFACSMGQSTPQSSETEKNPSPKPESTVEQSALITQPIRKVDFANFTYPWVADLGDPKQSFSVHDGELKPTRDEKGMVDEMGMILQSVIYGDATNDEKEEAMVVLSVVTGGSSIPHVIYVYTLDGESPKLLWAFSTGDRADGGLRKVYVDKGELIVERYGKEGDVGDCCPNIFTRSRYEWRDGMFKQKGKEETLSNSSGDSLPIMPPTPSPPSN